MRCLVLACVALLAGCAAPTAPVLTKTVFVPERLPAALLVCAPEPAVGPAWTSQADVADYLWRLEEAGADCRDVVRSIAQIEAGAAK